MASIADDTAVYFKKSIPFKHRRKALSFDVAQALFSSHQVDIGTRLLLRTLGDSDPEHIRKILDLGCGYGPLGLTLKKLDFRRTVHLVDRDALAVAFTQHNARQNKLSNAKVYGSLAYDAVAEYDFDLIVSNIPGKIGEPVIRHLIEQARHYLAANGFVAIVVVTPLAERVSGILSHIEAEILLKEVGAEHVVFHYRFPEGKLKAPKPDKPSVELAIYFRDKLQIEAGRKKLWLQTARGLPEYDTPFFETSLMVKALGNLKGQKGGRVLHINPGQGIVPLAAWQLVQPQEMGLVGHDLLSLHIARHNLISNGYNVANVKIRHQVGLGMADKRPFSLITQMLPKEQNQRETAWLLQQAVALLEADGCLLVGGRSTAVTRVETFIKNKKLFKLKTRKKMKGRSLLLLVK